MSQLHHSHPFFPLRTIAMELGNGFVQFTHITGRTESHFLPSQPEVGPFLRAEFEVHESLLHATMDEGTIAQIEIGTVNTRVDRPVIYLDQLHWIDLAHFSVHGTTRRSANDAAAARLFELALAREIILPLSTAHLVETTRASGRRRQDLARCMVRLSRGWQMVSPLNIRRKELLNLFRDQTDPLKKAHVFSLLPDAIWNDTPQRQSGSSADDLPADIQALVDRLSWASALYGVLLETEPTHSIRGAELATAWADSHHELAMHMRGNERARPFRRDLSRARFISDIQDDLVRASATSGMDAEAFGAWLATEAEAALSALPYLGRVREVLHLRLSNADDQWERNDLNDMLYLSCAAAYSDVVVGERKLTNYLSRVEPLVPDGAICVRRLEDAIPHIESLL